MGDYEIADVAEGVKISRMEMPSATFSFTFCSQNRTAENGSVVNGEDEAWSVADKAISYFKHAGQDDFLALGVAVVDVAIWKCSSIFKNLASFFNPVIPFRFKA